MIPYSTDAPLYHLPLATLGLIALNTGVFFTVSDPDTLVALALQFGRFHPGQWITSAFVHAGLMHLVGNMVFLWTFGMIVEGKLGWWKFLGVYLGIAAASGCLEQILMFFAGDGMAVGASGVINGLMIICMIWAPLNNLSIWYWLLSIPRTAEITIMWFAALYAACDFLELVIQRFAMSTPLLHLIGALLGAGVGVMFLRLGWVDCENWDLFSVMAGRHGRRRDEIRYDEAKKKKAQRQAELAERQPALLQQIEQTIADGQPVLAWRAHQSLAAKMSSWRLPDEVFLRLLDAFWEKQLWSAFLPPAVEYISQNRGQSSKVRLRLAQILVEHEHRPAQALRVLSKLSTDQLSAGEESIRQKIVAQAAKMQQSGDYLEVGVEDW